MRGLWLCVMVLAGCGSPDPKVMSDAGGSDSGTGSDSGSDAQEVPPDGQVHTINGAQSGTRLKLGWIQTADGLRHVSGTSLDYYDAMRAVDCRALVWADSKTYCTPNSARVVDYSDAACSSPLFVTDTGNPAPTYLASYSSPGTTSAMYTPGAVTTSITSYYTRLGSTCEGPFNTTAHDVYTLTPVTDLVELTRAFPGTGTLHESWYQSADGFAAPRYHQAYDPTLDVPCNLQQFATAPCRPETGAGVNAFATSGCTMNPLIAVRGIDPVPAFGLLSDGVFALGSPTTPQWVYTGSPTSCFQSAPVQGMTYYPLGSQVGTMVSVPIDLDAVTGHRLQPRVHGAGLNTRTGIFYDTVLDLDCAFGSSGGPCLPIDTVNSEGANMRTLYTNTSCTAAIDVVVVDSGTTPKFARTTGGFPPEIHPVTTQHTAPLYYQTSTNCEPAAWQYPPSVRFYDLGPAIPTSSFEQGTYYVDP